MYIAYLQSHNDDLWTAIISKTVTCLNTSSRAYLALRNSCAQDTHNVCLRNVAVTVTISTLCSCSRARKMESWRTLYQQWANFKKNLESVFNRVKGAHVQELKLKLSPTLIYPGARHSWRKRANVIKCVLFLLGGYFEIKFRFRAIGKNELFTSP